MKQLAARVCMLLALALPLLGGCAGLPAWLADRSTQLIAEGDRLAAEGRGTEALLAYRQAVDAAPRNVAALHKLADGYASEGRRRLALRYLRQAVSLSPTDTGLAGALAALSTTQPITAGLTLRWQASPVDGVPVGFALSGGALFISYEDGSLRGVAAGNGAVTMTVQTAGPLTSPPAVGDGLLAVGNRDGVLAALSATDGKPLWRFTSPAPIYAAPLITGSTVYCAGGDGTLYALDAATGTQRWKFTTGGALHATPTLANGMLFFGSLDGRIYAVDAATGAARWGAGVPTLNAVEAPAVVADGRVLIGSGDSRLYALAPDSGGEYWRYSTTDAIYAPAVVAGDVVYVVSGQQLAALDFVSGEVVWTLDAPAPLPYPPAAGSGILYYTTGNDSGLYAVDTGSGRQLWRLDTGDWLAAGPLLDSGAVYVLGKDGSVLAYGPQK